METWAIVILVVALLITLLAFEMPVAFALGLSGAVGLAMLQSFGFATNMLASIPFSSTSSFSFTIIPMFILMGMFAVKARIAEQVYAVANYACRKIPGGLGVATVMACAGFAAVSGSSIGTAATMSRLSVTEMKKFGYPESLAAGTVAVAGTLGILIPPSVMLLLYAIMTGESVAACLSAGIVPGIVSALAYMLYIMWAARRFTRSAARKDSLVDALGAASATGTGGSGGREGAFLNAGTGTAVETMAPASPVRLRDLPLRGLVRVSILFLIVLGGIYSGLFTPTESAAIGAVAAGFMLVLELRRGGRSNMFAAIKDALKDSASTTSMVFAIVVGSAILSMFFVAARLPETITAGVTELGLNPHLTMAVMLAMLLPLGMALESISILVITVPLLYPVAIELGFDGIWLAILVVKLIEIGMVTPPVGINCFVVSGTSGVKVETIFRGVMPFVLVDIVLCAILFIFPDIILWLPSLVNE